MIGRRRLGIAGIGWRAPLRPWPTGGGVALSLAFRLLFALRSPRSLRKTLAPISWQGSGAFVVLGRVAEERRIDLSRRVVSSTRLDRQGFVKMTCGRRRSRRRRLLFGAMTAEPEQDPVVAALAHADHLAPWTRFEDERSDLSESLVVLADEVRRLRALPKIALKRQVDPAMNGFYFDATDEVAYLRAEVDRLLARGPSGFTVEDHRRVSKFERLRAGENVPVADDELEQVAFDAASSDMSDAAFKRLIEDVIEADIDDVHYDLVMPFTVVQSAGGPFDDQAYCAGWEAGVIDVKLMALSAFGQSATDIVCLEANWPQVSLILMKHGWNVDESSMSIADGWVSVKVVGF